MRKSRIISDISQVLQDMEEMEMLLLVGLKRDSPNGRVDLLAGYKDGGIHKHAPIIEFALKNRWPSGGFFVCDDSVRFDLPMCSGGVAVCNPSVLVEQIKGWIVGNGLSGQHRPWATGYWLPEALCGDLATAESLYDAKGHYSCIKELVAPYPSSLAVSISDLCKEETTQKLATLEGLLGKNSPIEFSLCLSDIMASLVRLAFARSRCYFRGFKSLERQSQLLSSLDLSLYELAIRLSRLTPTNTKGTQMLIKEIRKLLIL